MSAALAQASAVSPLGALEGVSRPAEPEPLLRQDVDILPAPRERNGAPGWMLFNPVRNLFFRIGWLEFEMLSRWEQGDVAALAARVTRETRFAVEPSDGEALVRHLRDNQLTANEPGRSWKSFAAAEARRKHGPFKWMLHHYLFFRIRLLRPDQALARLERWSRFMFTPGFAGLLAAALLLGLYLAGRQ